MSLKQTIKDNTKNAMIEKDALKVSVLRMLSAAILNKEKEKRGKLVKEGKEDEALEKESQLSDEEVMEVINSEAKKRKDSIEQYEKGNRSDLADQEKKELEILSKYLPEQMGEEEIRKIIKDKLTELKIDSLQEKGKLMGALMPQFKGKADGNLVNKIVEDELSN